jgi:hypothetical protein
VVRLTSHLFPDIDVTYLVTRRRPAGASPHQDYRVLPGGYHRTAATLALAAGGGLAMASRQPLNLLDLAEGEG